MKNPTPISGRHGLTAVAILLIGGGIGYGAAHLGVPRPLPVRSAPAKPQRRVLYWYDPMIPNERYDHPGLSSMNMQTIPKYADDEPTGAAPTPGVHADAAAIQALGVRLAAVERGDFGGSIDATGVIDFNQRDLAIIQARAPGFVSRVYGRAPGDILRAGSPIVDLLIPTWGGAQGEFLAVRRTGDPALIAAARQRLRLLGMSDAAIGAVERAGRPRSVFTVSTPVGGVVQTLDVRQGMSVNAGQTLAQVAGLSTVWLNAATPEALVGQVRVGQTARAELAAFPGQKFTGKVTAILPTAQADSRTVQVRVELPNRDGRLKPGMFATVHLAGARSAALSVPSEAVIRTGKRDLVMVSGASGHYQPVQVRIGREGGGRTEVLAGLSEGDKVVASGQFLLDSEASLNDVAPRPLAAEPMTANPR